MKLFETGPVEISPAAAAALKTNQVTLAHLLSRHRGGDWGDLDAFSLQKNNIGLQNGSQLNSQYPLKDGAIIQISTNGDRSSTSIFVESDFIYEEVNAQKGYSIWATTYDIGRNPLIEAEEGPVEKLLEGLHISSVLDVGTGTGRYAIKLARRGARVTAIDQSPQMLALAKQKAAFEHLEIDFRLAALDEDLPFEANQYDFVVCALMLSHIPDLATAAQKFYRALQPDGHLLVTAYHPDIIQHGWRTVFERPGIKYSLPNVTRTRAEYLETLEATGFKVSSVIDVPVRNVPAGIFSEKLIESSGDLKFCLIILAQK